MSKVIINEIEEDALGAGPLFQFLGEILDNCSHDNNYCLNCPRRKECYSIWLELLKKTGSEPLKMDDFMTFAGRFKRLSTQEFTCESGQHSEHHTNHTPHQTKAKGAY